MFIGAPECGAPECRMRIVNMFVVLQCASYVENHAAYCWNCIGAEDVLHEAMKQLPQGERMDHIIDRETELLDFMKEHGYPIFHLSNVFYRDFQYGVRDYFRITEGKDIGTRKADEIADAVIESMLQRGLLIQRSTNTWQLLHDRYTLKGAGEIETSSTPASTENS